MSKQKSLSQLEAERAACERQGVDLLPIVHEGHTVRAMERKGIVTEKGEFNRWVKATNTPSGIYFFAKAS